jgi:predicted metal-binding membrane protein
MISATSIETFLRRDRSVVLAGLSAIIILSWTYMGYLTWDMANMMEMSDASMGMEMAMPTVQPWGMVDFLLVFIMWAVMMFAMMTPSAAPMVLTYSKISRQRQAQRKPVLGTVVFFLGYALVWTTFSAAATLAQGALHAATLLSPMMETTSPVLGGIILIAAGVFQFTPLKYACLSHCRTPLGFFMAEWREGKLGALVMGVRHGIFCVGCCWLIMALLFVAGVMNLFWIAVIAAYVLVEKLLPGGHKVSWAIGTLMSGWGVWMIMGVLL